MRGRKMKWARRCNRRQDVGCRDSTRLLDFGDGSVNAPQFTFAAPSRVAPTWHPVAALGDIPTALRGYVFDLVACEVRFGPGAAARFRGILRREHLSSANLSWFPDASRNRVFAWVSSILAPIACHPRSRQDGFRPRRSADDPTKCPHKAVRRGRMAPGDHAVAWLRRVRQKTHYERHEFRLKKKLESLWGDGRILVGNESSKKPSFQCVLCRAFPFLGGMNARTTGQIRVREPASTFPTRGMCRSSHH